MAGDFSFILQWQAVNTGVGFNRLYKAFDIANGDGSDIEETAMNTSPTSLSRHVDALINWVNRIYSIWTNESYFGELFPSLSPTEAR